MTEEEFENLHTRSVTLLGIATSIIVRKQVTDDDKQWWLHAIEEVIYKNKPIPELTKNKL